MSDQSALGQFFTPRAVVDFAFDALAVFGAGVAGARVADPACGPGEWLRAALERDPGNELVINDLAVISYRVGRAEDAAALLRRAVERHPRIEMLQDNFMDVMRALGRADEAERTLSEARRRMEGDDGG